MNSPVPYFVPSFPKQWTVQDIQAVDDHQNHQRHNQHSWLGNDSFQHHQLIPAAPYIKLALQIIVLNSKSKFPTRFNRQQLQNQSYVYYPFLFSILHIWLQESGRLACLFTNWMWHKYHETTSNNTATYTSWLPQNLPFRVSFQEVLTTYNLKKKESFIKILNWKFLIPL